MQRQTIRTVITVLALALPLVRTTPTGPVGGDDGRPPLGAVVGELRFVDTRGLPRASSELDAARALVLMFATNVWPQAQPYLPKYVELQQRTHGRGVEFLVVNVGPRDTVLARAERQVESGAAFPFVKDFDGHSSAVNGPQGPDCHPSNACPRHAAAQDPTHPHALVAAFRRGPRHPRAHRQQIPRGFDTRQRTERVDLRIDRRRDRSCARRRAVRRRPVGGTAKSDPGC